MFSKATVIFTVFLMSSCVTPSRSKAPKSDPDMIAKAEDTADGKPKTKSREQEKASQQVKSPSGKELWTFVRIQSKPNAKFGEEERNFVERIRSEPGPGSVSEAALVIGLVRQVLNPLHQQATTFEESDLTAEDSSQEESDQYAAPGAYSGTGPSLEKISKAHGLNIPDALSENPLLGSATVAKTTLEALRVGPNSQDFMNDVIFAIRARTKNWNEVALYLGDTPTPVTDLSAAETDEDTFDPNLAPNPADLRSGDSLIVDAQKYADKGNYEAALKRISMIPSSSPLYSVAQEKQRDFSNRAVQDLRRKAAQAFRSAMPSADIETRAQYLREAKTFLERAIKEFPAAPQLPTVRENLRVISQDLERLERSRG